MAEIIAIAGSMNFPISSFNMYTDIAQIIVKIAPTFFLNNMLISKFFRISNVLLF